MILKFLFLLTSLSYSAVDLHMHLTMDLPLAPFYSGSLNQNALATNWKTRLKSKIDFENLEKSNLQLIVAVIYVNPTWGGGIEEQFEGQMQELQKFCELHPHWKIVKEPAEAQEEIKKGNKVIILSLEGAWFYKEKVLFDQLIEKHGIRIVTPLHFSDITRKVGRAADQKGLFVVIQFFMNLFSSKDLALTPMGEDLFQYLLAKKLWIDLSHASSNVIEAFFKTRPPGYPLLMTHTVLKKYYHTDRGVDSNFLSLVKAENGVVGLLPSTEMLTGIPESKDECANANPFLVQWQELQTEAGARNVFLGSDLNSPIPGLPPAPQNCKPGFLPDGLRTAGDLKTLAELQSKEALSNFLSEWALVRTP